MTPDAGQTPDRPRRSESETEDPAFYAALGRAIKVARTERGTERKDLAEATGLSYAYLSDIESGRRRASSKALLAIAGALGMSPSELMRAAEVLTPRIAMEDQSPQRRGLKYSRSASAGGAPERKQPRPMEPEAGLDYRRSWFRAGSQAPVPPTDRGDTSREGSRDTLRFELQQLGDTLGPEDLELVLDLARRLAREHRPAR